MGDSNFLTLVSLPEKVKRQSFEMEVQRRRSDELKFGVERLLADVRKDVHECSNASRLPLPLQLSPSVGAFHSIAPFLMGTAMKSCYCELTGRGICPNGCGPLPGMCPSGAGFLPFGPLYTGSLHPFVGTVLPSAQAHASSNHGRRKRTWTRAVFSNLQRKGLEKRFSIQKYITKPDRRQLAATLGLTDAQVKVWFQNRRMKWRHAELKRREKLKLETSLQEKLDEKEDEEEYDGEIIVP